ncbi:hypothetical protein MRB53_016532 [Persea americana]|uniref:Uncharacterized protein n=1 Tax=Persea americana TaxID=3435 RepID=A0ACC2M2Z5_PERAE|nr:hypothetical protein MRB53_016532 [Persea americana]
MPPIATAREEPKAQEEKRGRRGRLWAVHVYGRNGVERKFAAVSLNPHRPLSFVSAARWLFSPCFSGQQDSFPTCFPAFSFPCAATCLSLGQPQLPASRPLPSSLQRPFPLHIQWPVQYTCPAAKLSWDQWLPPPHAQRPTSQDAVANCCDDRPAAAVRRPVHCARWPSMARSAPASQLLLLGTRKT